MNGFLLDTNVVSEFRKRAEANPKVLAWLETVADEELFLSVLVLGELRKGVELARRKDRAKARALEKWLEGLQRHYADRILPVDEAASDQWGRLNAVRPISTVDGLMAATAMVRKMTLVTRNVEDVAHTGTAVLNPFLQTTEQ